ncbi:glycosyltransferase [Pseudomonas sp. NPDC089406]|uniref:glycosyltransferase n=1 Tax=Pseudomonas sp. NPDC089406 TaxID=3364463 RepID=UPI003850577F
MPHLLAIGLSWPAPQACSAGRHLLHILEQFRRHGWRVTFACPGPPGEHKADLTALGIDEHIMASDDCAFAAADAVLFDGYHSEERYGRQLRQQQPGALNLLLTCGLESLRDARQQLLRRRLVEGLDPNDFRALFATPGPELYRQMAAAPLALRELAALWRCDLALVASDAELDLLVNGFGVPDYLLHHCPPVAEPLTMLRTYAERAHFITLGNLSQPANIDALLWIRHNLWPMLRRRLPDAQLHIHGANPSAKVQALHAPDEGLHFKGWVADSDAAMAGARVCLAPLRSGAGVKGQLLDALRCGTPSVTTAIGTEGMQGQQPWPGRVEGTAEALAKAAVELYSDEAAWKRAQDACAPLLRLRFDPKRHGSELVGRVEHSLGQLDELRLFNFTGAMLRQLVQF